MEHNALTRIRDWRNDRPVKVLLAILACERDVALQNLQRQMFLKNTSLDYRFFAGSANLKSPDVVSLGVSDDFLALPFKTQAMCRWAFENGYDFVFKLDTDTYLRPERLIPSGFQRHNYTGFFSYDPGPGAYASGGPGYWLSRASMEIVSGSKAIFLDMPNPSNPTEPSWRGEDLQVCWVLRDHGIHCHKDLRYCLRSPGPLPGNNLITVHDVLIKDKRQRLETAHRAWLQAGGRQ